jgi:branched-subunit amino acid aminotransferase/4-amino-4-deoxychorismate lyase
MAPVRDGPVFSLLETMRLEEGRVVRIDGHMDRMARAAAANEFAWDAGRVAEALAAVQAARPTGRWRVRLQVARDGEPMVQCVAFPSPTGRPWQVGFATRPVDEADPFLRIKTTERRAYETARQSRPDLDDVLLWTPAGEVTESTIANVVVEIGDARFTPPSSAPLLSGVFRAELLAAGRIQERRLSKHDVASASRLWLVNSLREWVDAALVDDAPQST